MNSYNAVADQAWALVEAKQLRAARDAFEKLCQLDPGNAEAWMMLGTISGELGELEKATSCLEKAIGIEPEYPDAQVGLRANGRSCRSLSESRAL